MEYNLEFLRKVSLLCKNFSMELQACGHCSVNSSLFLTYYRNVICDEAGELYAEVYDGSNWFKFVIYSEGGEHLEKILQ